MYIDNGLLSYCWKHKLYGDGLRTTSKESIEVVDAGLFDRHHGSRFFNAKVRIGKLLYVGNVLILNGTHDFYGSFVDYKKESTSVILVVCNFETTTCVDAQGRSVPVLEVEIPENVDKNASILMGEHGDKICHAHIMKYTSDLMRHAWLSAMQTEFLEEESHYLSMYYKECNSDIEETFFCAMLRAFGFNVNKVAMDLLARNIPFRALEHHRDDLFQVEAFILGQAGLLTLEPEIQCAVPEKYLRDALMEGYLAKMRNEYLYLQHKYSMQSISRLCWHPYGKGGLVYPHMYLSMLANWWYCRKMDSKSVLEVKTVKEAMELLNTHCTPYWDTHYIFGSTSPKCEKRLSDDRKAWLIMAGLVPFLFFCGRLRSNEELCDRAFEFMDEVKTFSTAETNHFKRCGLEPRDAGESLALTHLKTAYCTKQMKPEADERECLRCRFGYEFIKKY